MFIIAGAIIGCAKAGEDIDGTDFATGNVLRMDVPVPFTSLNPTTEESGSLFVFYFLYDKLFSMNEHGELVAELADSFHYAPDDRTWTINLKEGPCFHNGSPITANDVVYSLSERLKNLRPEIYESIEHITCLTEKSAAGCFEHPDITRILTETTTESRPERIKELFQQAEALMASLQPGTFLFHRVALTLILKRIDFPYAFSLSSTDIYRPVPLR